MRSERVETYPSDEFRRNNFISFQLYHLTTSALYSEALVSKETLKLIPQANA